MPKRIIRGLNHRPKQPKPATPLQENLAKRREQDVKDAEVANAEFVKKLKLDEEPQAEGSGSGDHPPANPTPEDVNLGDLAADEIDKEGEEVESILRNLKTPLWRFCERNSTLPND
ncbi:uncharacterized protein MELLADRAFT_114002 [Melampsora larici-populina 98AG31]|uniref:Uncharacterized protein n=1 Tax=Melampsora larici-populina (strain 98AG31 / pathotype 3-4-7) TaxID=747676 RepID=F4SBT6_MELLP|nr:uncharacterized protein MELLADRAFT_114002 [Melampsora larici-populina 98AG31]EGF97886.1 hypothetical protein MELLADRAFT_114002 [Melampsora larici-populina 98AG31]